MLPTKKEAAAERHSVRIADRVKWLLWLPVRCVLAASGWLKRRLRAPESAAALRAADKTRQSGVRRGLRGLPAAHDGGRPVA